MNKRWVRFGIWLGTLVASIVTAWILFRKWYVKRTNPNVEIQTAYDEYSAKLKEEAEKLAAMKSDEIVEAFRKAFGGKS